MQIVIAGAGSVGRSIARELIARGHGVTLGDKDPEAMKVSSVADANWILGDFAAPDVLDRAGTDQAEVLVAATGDDRANLVISLLAKTQFGVPRVIARVNNPKNEWMFDESWGVDVPVSTPRMMTGLVEEAVSVGTLVPLFHFYNSRNSLFSVVLPSISPVLSLSLEEVNWPAGVLLCAVMRESQPLLPSQIHTLQAGDQLLFLIPDRRGEAREELSDVLVGTISVEVPEGDGATGASGVVSGLGQAGVEEGAAGASEQQPTEIEEKSK
ncbi:MAG: TrkA family potassium uptake protein [Mobiluncus porci]|uniref:potassium channel family protein n=1 Tax=Mobiluncus porci TaxID=2652278 RepID=UPI0023F36393|nr:TrkA family potassium uptake protein [Mobiluncus porci]MDD7541451.1 TrkA family potassium uptake protein [Mobiluncus porci]MDY5748436.1 TrkA family potassium uptake protein [Mobiluncus porci]